MKRLVTLLLTVILILPSLAACSTAKGLYTSGTGDVKIVCTVFPIFDIARNVAGESASVTLLQDNGSDPHSYTPSAAALRAVSEADIFVYIGGAGDSEWAEEMLSSSENTDIKSVKLSEHINELLTPESTCTGADHSHSHSENFDDHLWSSLENAILIADAVKLVLTENDPENTTVYESNCQAYTKKLSQLSSEYKSAFENASADQLIFADRFPFVYLLHDYSFGYTAAFSGCSAETDSSYETLDILVNAVKSGSVPAVLTIDGSDKKLAQSVSEQTGCKVLTVNSLQSVTRSQIENGLTYIGAMTDNLSVFREALGSK